MSARLPFFILSLALFSACAANERDSPPYESNPEQLASDYAQLTREIFGEETSHELAVATVGEHTITAGEVAAYLSFFPTLTTGQATEDLVDIHLAAALGDEADAYHHLDARLRGRAFAWVRRNIWNDEALATPEPEALHALTTQQDHLTEHSIPPLATVTHVLFGIEGFDNHTDAHRAHVDTLTERVRGHLADLDRPVTGADLIAATETVYPPDDPLREVLPLRSDPLLTFPEAYSGPRRWTGLVAVVPEFAEAAFSAPLYTLVGPVESEYGWHLIVVEDRTSGDLRSEAEARELIGNRLIAQQRGRAIQAAVQERIQSMQVMSYEDNVALLSLSAEERVQIDAEQIGDRLTQ